MRLLVCAATRFELDTFGPVDDPEVGQLVTGVGVPAALASVWETAARARPEWILNLGIAGAYPQSGLGIGDLIAGTSEVYGDVGFELPDAPGFRPITESDFGAFYETSYPLTVPAEWGSLPTGRGCTVNQCTGTDATGLRRESLFGAAFETMEGAAVAQAGAALGIPVSEVRAISNLAARRDMRPDNIRRALDRLRDFFRNYP